MAFNPLLYYYIQFSSIFGYGLYPSNRNSNQDKQSLSHLPNPLSETFSHILVAISITQKYHFFLCLISLGICFFMFICLRKK